MDVRLKKKMSLARKVEITSKKMLGVFDGLASHPGDSSNTLSCFVPCALCFAFLVLSGIASFFN